MALNPLDPANTGISRDRIVNRGHGTRALGPRDSSDSGSDVQGPIAEEMLGDAGLDSDSDRSGTGERHGATPDEEIHSGSDIAPDHIEQVPPEAEDEGL
jgi:hypothetical protein